jgi:hypothetical protein
VSVNGASARFESRRSGARLPELKLTNIDDAVVVVFVLVLVVVLCVMWIC